MKHIFLAATIVAASAIATISPVSAATTVNFDQSTDTATYTSQGLKLTGFTISSNPYGNAVITPSAPNYAAASDGAILSFVDPTTGLATTSNGFAFTTVGLNAGNGYYDGGSLTFLDASGAVLGTQDVSQIGPNAGRTPFTYNNNYANIGSVVFSTTANTNGQGLFAIDDVMFSPNAVTGAVPEPATWGMMMAGLGMIGFGLRRRKSKVVTNVQFA